MHYKRRHLLFFNFFQRILLYFLFLSLVIRCHSENKIENEIEAISVSIAFDRFDLKFYGQDSQDIQTLKREYPFLFPEQFSDSIWAERQKDSLQLLLQDAVMQRFKETTSLEKEVSHLFKHIRYYFPTVKIPRVITLTNNVDYQIKTVYADSLLLLSLDTFLGADHPLYEGIPLYIRQELDPVFIPAQIVDKFATYELSPPKDRTFLAQLIYEGKKLFLSDQLLSHSTDAVKMAYTEAELNWVEENEQYIWQYLIEKQALYKTDPDWVHRFIDPAPFTKFYLELDTESPGKIGRWIGWQIVKRFAEEHPELTLLQILQYSEQEIFNASKYKPSR